MSHVDIPVTKLMFLVSFCSFLGYVIPSAIADGNVVNVGQGGTMEVLIFSMEKAVSFYSENIEKVNLDSVFGLRVGQGGINKAIIESKMHIKDDIFQRLVKLHAKILEIADRGFNKLRSSDSSYFHKFEHLIDGKWFSIMPYHNVDLSMVHKQPLSNDDSFDEASSDQCMTNLIGSQQSGIQKQCQITDKCWELMTKKGAEKYYLTHQGLFLILAENRGCRAQVLDKAGSDNGWENQLKFIGANIYHQMVETYTQRKTDDDEIGKDLFVEQIVVCQMLGVLQCFDSKFLDIILRMQDASGCWKQASKDEGNDAKEVINMNVANKEEQQMVVRLQGRKLQEEVVLQGGCSAHFTGVATGCLGLFIYWFSSHPDTHDYGESSNSRRKNKHIYDMFGGIEADAAVLFVMKWFIIFLLVVFSVYFFRKWHRNLRTFYGRYRKFVV